MADDREWTVRLQPVRNADRVVRTRGLPPAQPQRGACVAELRRRVAAGTYASERMMDAVARHLIESGDL